MKKVVLLVVALATLSFANAQFEAKINPLGAIFGTPDISGEYIVNDNFGVELSLGTAFGKSTLYSLSGVDVKQSGFEARIVGKYYFSPDDGGDGWYGGIYTRYKSRKYEGKLASDNYNGFSSTIFSAGVEVGRKWVFDSGFLIETAAAFGRNLSENRTYNDGNDFDFDLGFDSYYKFAIGYRFN